MGVRFQKSIRCRLVLMINAFWTIRINQGAIDRDRDRIGAVYTRGACVHFDMALAACRRGEASTRKGRQMDRTRVRNLMAHTC